MLSKTDIQNLLAEGKCSEAIQRLTSALSSAGDDTCRAQLHCLIGDAYYKSGNWKEAIQNYQEACDCDANSPAAEKLKMAQSILGFYNKDIYGQ